ncbi:Uncharacterized protein Fot_43009 [Forsythia ovata]|uniref:Uncharacterized protein n=1 Tax=Forsythia ovata TaxID=205694 RepID=A0ABD1RMU5_9LAMI
MEYAKHKELAEALAELLKAKLGPSSGADPKELAGPSKPTKMEQEIEINMEENGGKEKVWISSTVVKKEPLIILDDDDEENIGCAIIVKLSNVINPRSNEDPVRNALPVETPNCADWKICVWGSLRILTFSGKFSLLPPNWRAALSYALAVASAVSNVPNHTLAAFCGSLISAAHLPHSLCLTSLYLLLLSHVSSFEVLVISACGGCATVVVVAVAAMGVVCVAKLLPVSGSGNWC